MLQDYLLIERSFDCEVSALGPPWNQDVIFSKIYYFLQGWRTKMEAQDADEVNLAFRFETVVQLEPISLNFLE